MKLTVAAIAIALLGLQWTPFVDATPNAAALLPNDVAGDAPLADKKEPASASANAPTAAAETMIPPPPIKAITLPNVPDDVKAALDVIKREGFQFHILSTFVTFFDELHETKGALLSKLEELEVASETPFQVVQKTLQAVQTYSLKNKLPNLDLSEKTKQELLSRIANLPQCAAFPILPDVIYDLLTVMHNQNSMQVKLIFGALENAIIHFWKGGDKAFKRLSHMSSYKGKIRDKQSEVRLVASYFKDTFLPALKGQGVLMPTAEDFHRREGGYFQEAEFLDVLDAVLGTFRATSPPPQQKNK